MSSNISQNLNFTCTPHFKDDVEKAQVSTEAMFMSLSLSLSLNPNHKMTLDDVATVIQEFLGRMPGSGQTQANIQTANYRGPNVAITIQTNISWIIEGFTIGGNYYSRQTLATHLATDIYSSQ